MTTESQGDLPPKTHGNAFRRIIRGIRPATNNSEPRKRRLPRWVSLTGAVSMLCVACLFVGLILGWVLRGSLFTDESVATDKPSQSPGVEAKATLPMPDVRGLSEADARQVLADAGYDASIVKVSKTPSVVSAGTVAAQDPVAGTMQPVSITLSLPSPAVMPEIVGKDVGEASKSLAALGAQPIVKRIFDAKAGPGSVISTDPASGSPLTAAPTLTVASTPASSPLSALKGTGSCGSVTSGSVNGTAITTGVRCAGYSKEETTFWILGRGLSRLKGVVGIDDSSNSKARVKVTITADGKPLVDQEISYGQSVNLDADVSGVLRLELKVSDANAGTGSNSSSNETPYLTIGNAVLLGSEEAVAALGLTP
ncbi:PASTA domain-containing protein [Arthrobacter bambusae]|uniref:PASTA domain-containing protein n=1 Tax=Arthrobacter bambusae TaxID=1338426 RepID=A0AAW8DJD2_9MICC|nr:PASTA domain-containing protein [Arthrobacter bambusae]MDP9905604.1 hypothetical protein [Arthrobacter bambusae]MDQ0127314.1 hypothetical protein [Arthrobacter bambusae]MDQ0178656.1 hypothetical protein [Arthrobacter bambusae]